MAGEAAQPADRADLAISALENSGAFADVGGLEAAVVLQAPRRRLSFSISRQLLIV